mgnify:CR=1 FL=1
MHTYLINFTMANVSVEICIILPTMLPNPPGNPQLIWLISKCIHVQFSIFSSSSFGSPFRSNRLRTDFSREGYKLISYYSSNTALYMTKAPLIQLQIMEHELLSPETAKKNLVTRSRNKSHNIECARTREESITAKTTTMAEFIVELNQQ